MSKKAAADLVASRRGVDPDLSGSWENLLLRGTVNDWMNALKKSSVKPTSVEIAKALRGQIAAPKDAKWLALVELRGHEWLQACAFGEISLEELSKQSQRRLMKVGYQKTAGATYAQIVDAGRVVVSFDSSDDMFFHSKEHRRGWAKQFKDDEDALLDALVRGQDAFVPGFWASDKGGKLTFDCGQADVLKPSNVSAIAIVVLATNEKEAAQKMLSDGVYARDAAIVREALKRGADPHDPELLVPTLQSTVEALMTDKALAVLSALIEAGVELNGHRRGGGRRSVVGMLCDTRTPTYQSDDAIIATFEMLHRAGADFDVTGPQSKRTPMSFAAACGSVKGIQWLEKLGFDATKSDGSRKKPLARKAERREYEWLGPEVFKKQVKRVDAVIAYLSGLEKNKPAAKSRR